MVNDLMRATESLFFFFNEVDVNPLCFAVLCSTRPLRLVTLQRTPLHCQSLTFGNKCTREVGVYILLAAGRAAAAAAAKNGVEAVSVYNMATRALSPTAPPPSYQPPQTHP